MTDIQQVQAPQQVLRQAREALLSARAWVSGDKWRFSNDPSNRQAWAMHANNLDATVAKLDAALSIPAAEMQTSNLHAAIMNLPDKAPPTLAQDVTREHFLLPQDPIIRAYRLGCRNTRHAAAELVAASPQAAQPVSALSSSPAAPAAADEDECALAGAIAMEDPGLVAYARERIAEKRRGAPDEAPAATDLSARIDSALTAGLADRARELLAARPKPVAWGRSRYITDRDGRPIGMDEPELEWGEYPPDESGWWPLFATPTGEAAGAAVQGMKVRDVGFKYENGSHTPTVLVTFAPNDWEARDAFAKSIAATPQAVGAAQPASLSGVAAPAGASEWERAQAICDLPAVDEAISNLLEDNTGDNATCLVREVMRAALSGAPAAASGQVQPASDQGAT